jgi:hypothetical protein
MRDHETYLLLAAKRLTEPLSREEEADLEAHLASCPSCRSIAAGMRRDDVRLRGAFGPVPVAPRVRERVLSEAAGRSPLQIRAALLLAAALALGLIGAPLIAGGPGPSPAASAPSPSLAVVSPSASPMSSLSPSESIPASGSSASAAASASAPPPPGAGQSVNGSFTYSEAIPKRAGISAHFVEGRPEGAWSRRVPATGDSQVWKGKISCLVVSGNEAWMAGPVTQSPDGTDAIFILVRDVGPEGEGDRAMMWLNLHGETLDLLEGWCRDRFRPGAPVLVSSGDIEVHGGGH